MNKRKSKLSIQSTFFGLSYEVEEESTGQETNNTSRKKEKKKISKLKFLEIALSILNFCFKIVILMKNFFSLQ